MSGGIEDVYPVLPGQQGMLIHALREPGTGVYVEQRLCVVEGGLDLDAARETWLELQQRHPALRTGIHWEGLERPVQVVERAPKLPVTIVEAAPGERREDFVTGDALRGFALDRPPLWRVSLVPEGSDRWLMLWTFHHIILDGWSAATVLQEFVVGYSRRRRGETAAAPPRPDIREFARWIGGRDRAADLAVWLDRLKDFGEAIPLPQDEHAAGEIEPGRFYGHFRAPLPPGAHDRLSIRAREIGVTPAVLGMAAWTAYLHRISGRDDVLFATTVAGRPHELAGADEMVGALASTIPIRVHLGPETTVRELAHACQTELQEFAEALHVPMADVSGALQRSPTSPLFHSLFVVQNFPLEIPAADGLDGLTIAEIDSVSRTNLPLCLVLVAPGRMSEHGEIIVTHDRRVLTAAGAERVVAQYVHLLDRLVEQADGLVEDLDILPAEERHRVVRAFNEVDRPLAGVSEGMTGMLRAVTERFPDQTAVVVDGDPADNIDYRTLDQHIGRMASHLRALGAGRDRPVAVSLARSLDLVVTLLAAIRIGAPYVPLDPALPVGRRAFMIADSGPAVLVTTGVPDAGAGHAPVVCMDDEDTRAEIGDRPVEASSGEVQLDDVLCILYTSGTTGRPKGVMLPHRYGAYRLATIIDEYPMTPDDRTLLKTSTSFDIAMWELLWPLMTGGAVVVARPNGHLDPAYLADVIERTGVTTVHFVPSMLREFLNQPLDGRCAGLRRVISSGEALTAEDARWCLRALPHVELHNQYGPTETGEVTVWQVPGPDVTSIRLGHPLANMRRYVLDGRGRPVPIGVPGELYVASPELALGYLNRPRLTAQRFTTDRFAGDAVPMYRTGDIVCWLPDGDLEFLGRADDQVKIRGFRVEPAEVANRLRAVPGVTDAVVVVDRSMGEPRLIAYATVGAGSGLTGPGLRRQVGDALPDYMVPAGVALLDRIPRTTSGKLATADLPPVEVGPVGEIVTRAGADAAGADLADTEELTVTEALLADVWKSVVGVPAVRRTDDFFAIGGHSLHAVRIVSRLRKTITPAVPIELLFDHPVLTDAAHCLAGLLDEAAPPGPSD